MAAPDKADYERQLAQQAESERLVSEIDPDGKLRRELAAHDERLGLNVPNVRAVRWALRGPGVDDAVQHVAGIVGALLLAAWSVGPLPILGLPA